MKRKVILLLMLSLLVCGCSSKTMVCSGNSKDEQRETNQEYILEYKDNTIFKVSQTTKHKFKDKKVLDIYVDAFDSYVKDLNSVASESKGYIIVETNIGKDNSYTIKIDAEVDKIDDYYLNKINMVRDLDELKEILETSGLTCK